MISRGLAQPGRLVRRSHRLAGRPSSRASSSTAKSTAAIPIPDLGALKDKRVYTSTFNRADKPRIVIVGSGWAGFNLARDLDKRKYDVTVISDRNHFLFTPLLPSTTVGTLEFRAIQEPVRTIPKVHYYQAKARSIDFENRRLVCEEVFHTESFTLVYDALIIAVGSRTNTFNVPGVSQENNVYFLKQLSDARAIRSRIIECFERASYPGLTTAEKSRLLSFVVVGGGPTSVEFASELYDFLKRDVHKWYADLEDCVSVTLVEASQHILGTFDHRLVEYTSRLFKARKIRVLTGAAVMKVEPNVVVLKDGTPLHFGMCVWSTGVKATPLVENMKEVQKGRGGRILIDQRLRVIGHESQSVFAMGDCAVAQDKPLPALAQVAQQQARYLANCFNRHPDAATNDQIKPFEYRHLLSMAQLGMWQGVADTTQIVDQGPKPATDPSTSPGVDGHKKPVILEGIAAFLLWRSAYWTKSVSLSNKILIPMYWFKSWLFGRDISRF